MSQLYQTSRQTIVRFGSGSRIFILAVLAVFFSIGAGILGFIGWLWSLEGFDPAWIWALAGDDELGLFGLMALFIGFVFCLIPLVMVRGLIATKQGSEPSCFVFDHGERRFLVCERPWKPEDGPVPTAGLGGYAYGELAGFRIRQYTTTSSSSSTGSHSTTHYVVCLERRDGSLWDLHDTLSRDDAERFQAELERSVPISGAADAASPAGSGLTALPAAVQRTDLPGAVLFAWPVPSRFGGILAGLVFIGFFVYVMARIAEGELAFLIFGGLVCGIITLVLLKALWDGLVALGNLRGLLVSQGTVSEVLVPKARFSADAVRKQKTLDAHEVARVRLDWRLGERRSADPELVLLNEDAARDTAALESGDFKPGRLLAMAKSLHAGALRIALPGLSLSEAMAMERLVEEAVRRQGGSAL